MLQGYQAIQPFSPFLLEYDMKITNIEFQENNLVITLDSSTEVTKVYIDTLLNGKNKYSEKDEDHSYAIEVSSNSDTITIDYTELDPELDTSAFTILINGVLGFYFDDKELYYAQVNLLTNFCSTCLDKHQKEKIMLFLMKQQLLQYAIDNELIDDQIQYYTDLARLFNIDLDKNSQAIRKSVCYKNMNCCNGCCALC